MKNFNFPIARFSFLFSLTIFVCISLLSYAYMLESIAKMKIHEEHLITFYANKITKEEQTIAEFKNKNFGTLESFLYKVAIIGQNNEVFFSSFDKTPVFNHSKQTYFDKENVFYNSIKQFTDIGTVQIIVAKTLDYSDIYTKIIFVLSGCLLFLLASSLFLYFHIKGVYSNITKQLDVFFKDAIHEIRTPLGVIQINLDFLDNTLKNSIPLKRAQGGLRNLTSIYESLEYSIKNKKVQYKKESINLSQFLHDRIDFFQVLAEVKYITIVSNVEAKLMVNMSRIELQRLIDNNLSNAIKYAKDTTTIAIDLKRETNFAVLGFTNSGEQIEDVEKIFIRYYRGDDIRGGFGLGLSIVKYICDLYAIKINVISNEKGESTFTYYFPINTVKE